MLSCMNSARQILAANLRHWMARHPDLNDRPKLASRSGISPRTIGYMMQSGAGNPTLANIEAVAKAFGKPVWHLLIDVPVIEKLLLLDKILNTTAVPDETLGDKWDATKNSGHHVAAEPSTPAYLPAKKARKPR